MKTDLSDYKALYKPFKRNTGEVSRTNKFSMLLLSDAAFRRCIRNNKDFQKVFDKRVWTDENLLSNLKDMAVYSDGVTWFCDNKFMLNIPYASNYRVASSKELIAYSKDGHYLCTERASVLYKKHLKNCGIFIDNEKVLNRLAELFSIKWKSYVEETNYELHIDKDFDAIYSVENFQSCMTGLGFHTMYANSVKGANACYITDSDGKIKARAILWDSVYDGDGNTYKYLDRIYSKAGKEDLQRILLDKVLDAKAIDLYKPVGASCADAKAVVDLKGKRIGEAIYNEMWVDDDDPVCYLDTFKYYDKGGRVVSNDEHNHYDYELTRTDGVLYERTWSDYYEDYIEGDAVWSEDIGSFINADDDNFVRVDDDNREDYVHIDNAVFCNDDYEYHHIDDVVRAEDTYNYFYDTDGLYYTEDTECYFENEYRLFYVEGYGYYENDDNLVWSDINNTYILEDDSIYIEDLEDYDYVGNKTDYHNIDGKLYAKDESIVDLIETK